MKKLYLTCDYAKLNGVIDLQTERKEGEFAFNVLKNSEWKDAELYLIEIEYNDETLDYNWDARKLTFKQKKPAEHPLDERIKQTILLTNPQ